MQSEIAKMFTTLGFKVDMTGLNEFESKLRQLRASSANFARNLNVVGDKLDKVRKKVSSLNSVLNKDLKATGSGTSQYYSKLASYVERVDKAHNKLNSTTPSVISSLNRIRSSVHRSSNAWERYAQAVTAAKQSLRGLSGGSGLGSGGRITINNRNITNNYYGGGRGGGSGSPSGRPGQGQGAQGSNTTILGGISGFMRSMTPATMLAGGAVSAGFAVKEVVQAGREVQKMQNVMLMASKGNQEVLKQNLGFVEASAKEMGISYVEFGQAYSKMLMATDTSALATKDKEKMFKDLSAYMVAIGQSEEDQKGTFRALTQMFTKGKIQAEEMLQMAERGVPAASMIKKAAMESLKITSAEYEKLQQKGLLDPAKILPKFAEMLGEQARSTGAFAKAVSNDVAAQQRLKDEWKKFSFTIMSSGLSEGLGKLFNGLADLLQILSPLAKEIMGVVKSLSKLVYWSMRGASESKGLSLAIIALLGILLRYRLILRGVALASGSLSVALGILIRTLAILFLKAFVIVGVFWAIHKVMTALDDKAAGKLTWMDVWEAKLELLRANLMLFMADIDLMFAKIGWYIRHPAQIGDAVARSGLGEAVDKAISYITLPKTAIQSLIGNPSTPPSEIPKSMGGTQQFGSSDFNLNLNIYDQYGRKVGEDRIGLGGTGNLTYTANMGGYSG